MVSFIEYLLCAWSYFRCFMGAPQIFPAALEEETRAICVLQKKRQRFREVRKPNIPFMFSWPTGVQPNSESRTI